MIIRTIEEQRQADAKLGSMIRTYIDGKGVVTDWIEDIYNGDYSRKGDTFVGFYDGVILICVCSHDCIKWMFTPYESAIDKDRAKEKLIAQLESYNDDDNRLISVIHVWNDCLCETFYREW